MKTINLSLILNERLGLKSVTINYNDTDLPSDSELIRKVSITLLKSLSLNKDTIIVQDLLNELGIERATP